MIELQLHLHYNQYYSCLDCFESKICRSIYLLSLLQVIGGVASLRRDSFHQRIGLLMLVS
jgi:hypothetical protein